MLMLLLLLLLIFGVVVVDIGLMLTVKSRFQLWLMRDSIHDIFEAKLQAMSFPRILEVLLDFLSIPPW